MYVTAYKMTAENLAQKQIVVSQLTETTSLKSMVMLTELLVRASVKSSADENDAVMKLTETTALILFFLMMIYYILY